MRHLRISSTMWPATFALAALALLTTAFWHAAPEPVLAHPGITTSVTWTRDVSRIIEHRCAHCHREGGAAPMALTSYEAARPWARAIREEVLERRMPPTGIRSGAGRFSNARSLSWAESELLVSWADGGAPKGDGADAVAPEDGIAWTARAAGEPIGAPEGEPLVARFRVALDGGVFDAWTIEPGSWPMLSATLRSETGMVVGRWSPSDRAIVYPAGAGVRVAPGGGVTLEAVLTRAPEAADPSAPVLHVRAAAQPGSAPVARYTVSPERPAPASKGERLLGFRLSLGSEHAEAQLVLKRGTGEELFLFGMAAPGVPDPVLYRLRQPLVREAGDTLEVRTSAPFELEVESVAGAKPVAGAAGR